MSWTSALTALAAPLGFAAPLAAQIGLASTPRSIQLTAVRHGSVSVTLPAARAATLGGLAGGPNDFAPLPVATRWTVDPARTASVTLVAFFGTPARALAGPRGAIPAAAMQGRLGSAPGGYARFVQGPVAAVGTGGGSLVLFSQPIAGDSADGGRTDDLLVRIDLTNLPDLAAGTYTGTLSLVAVTQ